MATRRAAAMRVGIWSGAILLSTMGPYLLHWAQPVPGRVYTGLERYLNDQASYLMWTNQVRLGRNDVTNLYVHDLRDRFAPNPLWWLLGLLGRATPVSTVALYHAARLALGFAYLLALYPLVARFCRDRLVRTVAWWLCAVGGGFAWLRWAFTGQVDLDGMWVSADYMPEMWSYSSVLYFPHFAAGLLLMVAALYYLIRAWESGRQRKAVASGLLLGLLVLVHTYTAVTLALVLVIHAVCWRLSSRRWAPCVPSTAIALLVGLPFLAGQSWQVSHHEALRRWAESNVMHSPWPSSYVLGAGLVGLAAVLGFAGLLSNVAPLSRASGSGERLEAARQWLLLVWVVGTLLLLYSGLKFERRCVEGLHLALCLLAAPVVVAVAQRLAKGQPRHVGLMAALLVAACSLTSAWCVLRELPSKIGYVPPGVFAAERTVYQRVGPEAPVLCDAALGQWIASVGRLRVYAGHMQLTYDIKARLGIVAEFFDPSISPRERLRRFARTGCRAVIAEGDQARVLQEESGEWEELLRQGDVGVFVVKRR